jgi:methylmalonyl-CoA mutase
MQQPAPYAPQHKIRLVTAASLFDGHDAAINIMRRIMQSSGAEIIHLGHNRSVQEIVDCAIQEDVQGIAITSYQGGHIEFFKYMYDLLKERGAGHIRIFGGGGGTILPDEIRELHEYGITRIYHPDDGRAMGLQGMINDVLQKCDFSVGTSVNGELRHLGEFSLAENAGTVARLISVAENNPELFSAEIVGGLEKLAQNRKNPPVLGITGTGGAGKSSMVDELVRRFLRDFPDKNIGIISVDPSKRKTGGALLGDRIRMNAINSPRVYMRSLATRQSNLALSRYVHSAVDILKAAHYDLIILETSGIGQSDTEIVDHSDVSLYIMTPEFGAATQLEKIDMLDFADVIAINKFDKRGALDALRDVRKQVQRNRNLWDIPTESMPVFGCIASQFNDPGVNQLYRRLMELLAAKSDGTLNLTDSEAASGESEKIYIIPPNRTRYLSEISENNRKYDEKAQRQSDIARNLFALHQSVLHLGGPRLLDNPTSATEHPDPTVRTLVAAYQSLLKDLDPHNYDLPGTTQMNTCIRCATRTYVFRPTRKVSAKHGYPRWHCPDSETGEKFSDGRCRKMYRASSPTQQACFPSSAKAKTPHACLRAKAAPNVQTAAFTMFLWECRQHACPRHLIQLHYMVKTPTLAPIYMVKSATPV